MNENSKKPLKIENIDALAPDQPLYASRARIHPKRILGTFRSLKWSIMAVLLGFYYGMPWLRWDRGPGMPDQAFLADITGRRLFFLDVEIWPQEIYYLTGLLILGAVGLFFVTSLFGRVWCGFTCPQTVWTDLFMLVERYIEGDRNKRIKLDALSMNFEKLWRRSVKHAVWLVISAATGGAWIMYFVDAPTLGIEFFSGQSSLTVYALCGIFTSTTYLLGGLAREQVCLYMCPWPRFQGAMFDEHTLLVTYEDWRGEPRGKARQKASDNLGDCIDCDLCVNVCPTGIDIRDGQQMQCIGCALCVDACNTVMKKIDRPGNLIRYDSIANMVGRANGAPAKYHFVRMRTVVYAVIIVAVMAAMVYGLYTRANVDINLQRDRTPLFVQLSDGEIRNGYTLKVLNKERLDRTFRLRLIGIDGAYISVIGIEHDGKVAVNLPVKADVVGTFHVFVRAPADNLLAESTDMKFVLTDIETGDDAWESTFFFGPKK